jgi:hypothetical protein
MVKYKDRSALMPFLPDEMLNLLAQLPIEVSLAASQV